MYFKRTLQQKNGYEYFTDYLFILTFSANGREIQRMINSHVEASKIGRQIAEQVLDHQRRIGDSSSGEYIRYMHNFPPVWDVYRYRRQD